MVMHNERELASSLPSTTSVRARMSNPYGEQDDHQSAYYFASTSNASSRGSDGHQTQQHHHQQQQQSTALLNTAMDDPSSPLQYSHIDAENSKLAMEMIGITPTTFSSNIQFQIPRFMQDAFDPALLHASSGPTSSSAFPSSSSPNTQHQSALIASMPNPSYGYNSWVLCIFPRLSWAWLANGTLTDISL
jgi:hypothetical protein